MNYSVIEFSSQQSPLVLSITHDDPGGARNLWEQIALYLRGKGYDVALTSLYQKDFQSPGEWCFVCKQPIGVLGLLSAVWRLRSMLNQSKPKVLISALPVGNIVSALAGFLAAVPNRIATHHSPLTTYGPFQRWLDLLIGCSPAVTAIVCVSEGVRQSMVGYPRAYLSKVSVIRNALAPEVAAFIDGIRLPFAHGVSRQPLKVISAGRLAKQKNYEVLLRAIALTECIHLDIIGDGPEGNALRELAVALGIQDRVNFIGLLPHRDTLERIASADVFAQPSLFEGHSVALLEAAALGRPLVVSDVPTQVEAVKVRNGAICAAIAPVSGHVELANILNRCARDEGYLFDLHEKAKLIANEAGFDRLIAQYLALAE